MSTKKESTTASKAKAAAAPVTAPVIQARKGGEKIACMTAYDYSSGMIADASGMDLVLVGDSLAMVVLGHEDTLSVTMDEMIHHVRATNRGVKRSLLVADMPFMSYATVDDALKNAGRFISEGRAKAIKLEGGTPVVPQIKAIVEAGIPVMGHIGLTPQHVAKFGGFKAQGKSVEAAKALVEDARAVEAAGAFCVVLEAIPVEVAEIVTKAVDIPTIGIGAGNVTDGQILVYHDVLGLFDRFTPKFVRTYAKQGKEAIETFQQYVSDVHVGRFPGDKNTIYLSDEVAEQVRKIKIKKKK